MTEQILLKADCHYNELDHYFETNSVKKIFLVCGNSIGKLPLDSYFQNLEKRKGISVVYFQNFTPNPRYEEVVKGVALFQQSGCDLIAAVGGGSAMDVAKCIKLYSNMEPGENYLTQAITPSSTKFLAVPTTAGTGSEATRYAVIYYQGEKQSISDESCIPSAVLMDPSVLKTLPDYQRKATMLDALCHGMESFWSVHSTEESRQYSRQAIQKILKNRDSYLQNDASGNAGMLYAANLAGKAINITQTTAGHAMCYKLTSLYGISHGHGAALCVTKLWPYMQAHLERCIDPRGENYIQEIFTEIAHTMGYGSTEEGIAALQTFYDNLKLSSPVPSKQDYDILKHSVNPERLKNNPIALDEDAIDYLYHQILG